MMRRYVLFVLFSMNALYGACTFGPSGINQWELLNQVANCINQCSGSSGGSCSSLDSVSDVLGSKLDACCFSLSNLDRLILSDVDSVSSKVDLLASKSDFCCSALDVEIRSVSDVLSNKINQVDTVVTEIDNCLVGTAITQADIPFTITTPGVYLVCEDISAGFNLIDIQSDNVILDLNGHILESLTGRCVTVSGVSEVMIKNGFCTSQQQTIYVNTGSKDVTISDVKVYDSAEPSIFATGTHGLTILDCTIDGFNNINLITNGGMIRADTCSGIFIEGCRITGKGTATNSPGAACRIINQQVSESPATIKNCVAEVVGRYGFTIESGSLDGCLIENCVVAGAVAPGLSEAFYISGTGGCELIRCAASGLLIGFSMLTYGYLALQDCIAQACTSTGFILSDTNAVLNNCIASANSVGGFSISGNDTTLSFCNATTNGLGFSILGSRNVLQQCVASRNVGSGIDNTAGIDTFIIDTRSSAILPACPYQLNGAADIFGTATIIPESNCCSPTPITQTDIPLTITTPGTYIVCEDISAASNLIDIQASNVTLDLNGHTLESTTGICVTVNNVAHVVVTNGFCTSALQSISVVTGSQDVSINDVHIYNSAEPSIHAIGTHGVTVSGCSIDGRNGSLLALGMILIDTCSEVLIEDSTIIGGNDFASTPIAACIVTNIQTSEGGAIIRRCTAEVLNEIGFSIDTSLNSCIIEDCFVGEFIGTVKEGYRINGSGSCQLIRCSTERAGIGFSLVSYSDILLQDCIALTCSNTGFRFQSSNGVAEGCVASSCPTGFSMQGTNVLLSECKATANSIAGFSIIGTNTVLQQCVASGNSGSGINNSTGTNTFLIDTRSSSVALPAYQLNTAADAFGTATIITF